MGVVEKGFNEFVERVFPDMPKNSKQYKIMKLTWHSSVFSTMTDTGLCTTKLQGALIESHKYCLNQIANPDPDIMEPTKKTRRT